jgi:hypothetical protein
VFTVHRDDVVDTFDDSLTWVGPRPGDHEHTRPMRRHQGITVKAPPTRGLLTLEGLAVERGETCLDRTAVLLTEAEAVRLAETRSQTTAADMRGAMSETEALSAEGRKLFIVRRFRSNLFLIFSRHASCTGDCWCDTLLGALH